MRVAEMFTPMTTTSRHDCDWGCDDWREREPRHHHGHWRYYRSERREWCWDD
jgi:hypothetical protein